MKEEPYNLDLLSRAMNYAKEADVLVIDGSALKDFPVPNLMHAYQGHKMILFNTAPLVFDARAGLILRDSFSHAFEEVLPDLDLPQVDLPPL